MAGGEERVISADMVVDEAIVTRSSNGIAETTVYPLQQQIGEQLILRSVLHLCHGE
jgi:hypothetical protein